MITDLHIYGIEPSARALAKALNCNYGLRNISRKTLLIVNWGRSDLIEFHRGSYAGEILNEKIILDKLKQHSLFEKAGISVPKVIALEGQILRTKEHRGGRDIKFLDKHYVMEWIEKEREYRVHVFGGKVIRVARKVPHGEAKIWNNENAHFKYELKTLPIGLKTLAVRAVEALGYDFGAVDIIMDKNKKLYVLEVNSAPGLDNPRTLEAYVNAIRNYTV